MTAPTSIEATTLHPIPGTGDQGNHVFVCVAHQQMTVTKPVINKKDILVNWISPQKPLMMRQRFFWPTDKNERDPEINQSLLIISI